MSHLSSKILTVQTLIIQSESSFIIVMMCEGHLGDIKVQPRANGITEKIISFHAERKREMMMERRTQT